MSPPEFDIIVKSIDTTGATCTTYIASAYSGTIERSFMTVLCIQGNICSLLTEVFL